MNKICTSIEQSKKLIELGIDANTADMYYFIADSLKQQEMNYAIRIGTPIVKTDIPAWSLAALLDVTNMVVGRVVNPDIWICSSYKLNLSLYADNPIDACYAMMLRLKEKNLL